MPQDLADDKSTLVQVMAWYRQAPSHYLRHRWVNRHGSHKLFRHMKMPVKMIVFLLWEFPQLSKDHHITSLFYEAKTHNTDYRPCWRKTSSENTWNSVVVFFIFFIIPITVETLYSTIYYSKYFIELNFDKSTQYVALWTHKRHSIPRPFGRAMECLLWVLQQKLTVL